MQKLRKRVGLTRLLIFLFIMAGCAGNSFEDGGDDTTTPASSSESLSVAAVSLENMAQIDLYIKEKSEDEYIPLENGDHVLPGVKILGIDVQGEPETYERVIVSDGGEVQVDAALENGKYTCFYSVKSGYPIQVILVQAVHPGGKASKKKIVVRTDPDIADNAILNDGVGMLLGANLLDHFKSKLPDMIPMDNLNVEINALTPADQEGRDKGAVMYMDAIVGMIPFAAEIGMEDNADPDDAAADLQVTLIDPVVGKGFFSLALPDWLLKLLHLDSVEVSAIDLALEDLTTGFLSRTPQDDVMASIFSMVFDTDLFDLDDKHLLLDVYGLPEQTRNHAVAMGAICFPLDNSVNQTDAVRFLYDVQPSLSLSPDSFTGDLGLDFSQHSLNQVAGLIISENSVKIDTWLIRNLFPSILSDIIVKNGFESWISFNPSGLGFVMHPLEQRLVANDVRVALKQNHAVVWQLSFDMQFQYDLGFHKESVENEEGLVEEHTILDVYVSLIAGDSHCHEMSDNIGMGMVDHTGIMPIFFDGIRDMLNIAPEAPFFSLDITGMGADFNAFDISSSEGRCFLDLALSDQTDFEKISTCFFSTMAE